MCPPCARARQKSAPWASQAAKFIDPAPACADPPCLFLFQPGAHLFWMLECRELTEHRKQTRKASLAESLVNVAVGYCLSVAVTAVVLGCAIYIPLASNLAIGLIFTVVSIARSFALRRLFEALRVRGER
jgi:hypothetical protein